MLVGLAPRQTGQEVYSRLLITTERAFLPSACWFVLFMQSQLGTVEIYFSRCFLQQYKTLLYAAYGSAKHSNRLAALGNKDMSDTELCSPLPRISGSNKIANAKIGYCIFPSISLEVMGNVLEGLSCTLGAIWLGTPRILSNIISWEWTTLNVAQMMPRANHHFDHHSTGQAFRKGLDHCHHLRFPPALPPWQLDSKSKQEGKMLP